MTSPRNTRAEDLLRAVEIGQQADCATSTPEILPGKVGQWEDTRCTQCGETLIKRYGT